MASTDRNVAVDRGSESEDPFGSASSAWAPYTVMKIHRKKATLIWVSLLMAFFGYVGYIIWDTVDARRSPAASIEVKKSPFSFPDVAVCETFLNGCLSSTEYCLQQGLDFTLLSQWGFMENVDDFSPSDYPDVAKVQAAFPHCLVMPLSKLTVDEWAVKNGDITSFSVSMAIIWNDNPGYDFDATETTFFAQYVSAHFIDIEEDVDDIGETVVDVKLPYQRVLPQSEEWFTSINNHMVISLTEFSGITKTGKMKERERTYSQTTTSGTQNWFWADDSSEDAISILRMELLIKKFEYTSIQEVDPVDGWAIIGAIGGVWQFVVIAFGIFFVFSERQPADKKMRNLHDTVVAPATTFNRRLSSVMSSRLSMSSRQGEDVEIDATDEDLPPDWLKLQRQNGSVYYSNMNTGSTRFNAPRERNALSESTRATASRRRQKELGNLFQAAHDPQDSGTGDSQGSGDGTNDGGSLPPGWIEKTDSDDKVYYVDTINKKAQWIRPTWRANSTSDSGLRTVDLPMKRIHRSSSASSFLVSVSAPAQPSPTTATTGDVADTSTSLACASPPLHPSTTTATTGGVVDTGIAVSPPINYSYTAATTSGDVVCVSTSSLEPASPPFHASTTTTKTEDVVGKPLPPNWETRITPEGKTYYANRATKETQWKYPRK